MNSARGIINRLRSYELAWEGSVDVSLQVVIGPHHNQRESQTRPHILWHYQAALFGGGSGGFGFGAQVEFPTLRRVCAVLIDRRGLIACRMLASCPA